MKLNLDNYDKIIFDMDGVITTEQCYWEAAALGAYDLLFSHEHYGVTDIDREFCRKNYKEIYNMVMCGGRTVRAVKRLGINTNWDLLYAVFCVSKYLNPTLDRPDADHFQSVCMFIENIEQKAPDIYFAFSALVAHSMPEYTQKHFERGGDEFWKELFDVFDIWYSGSDDFDGVNVNEEMLFEDDDLKKLFTALREKNITLGIGTGRPREEIIVPLTAHGLIDYFDLEYFVSFDEVCEAEKEVQPELPLAKPDPFVFEKAALGNKYTNKEIHEKKYDKSKLNRTLIVGDAPSDLLSAQAAKMDFLGVLTGVEGDGMLSYFTQNNADYILDNVLDMLN